ncbi:hypothetical protein [Paenibacillus sp. NEAU-GSW1]|uniref:hypothetical protein n=1 Tax=Paenibacillus sp. NEAU-GSW1 TaxID=2682486 RepID=UPI0012E2AB40|nr:hypothetical protein [Paenibacillus sp. NEAU-GSW1]MUT66514.1 hypothetical protein [Paenibacillus sp. NEAU-GSW1]
MEAMIFKKKEPVARLSDHEFKAADVVSAAQDTGAEEAGDKAEAAAAAEETFTVMSSSSKANLDKKSLDLIFAVEQMIQARQHADRNIHELQDRLNHANNHVDRLNRDVKNLNKVIEEREKNILELENKLIEKNLKVDQVMEDYRELQTAMSAETEELKGVIDLEQQKYSGLLQKHNEAQAERNKRINELEEKISRLEAEAIHMRQKYEATRQEKTYLANMIQDFTNRMSVPFGNANSANHGQDGGRDS